MNDNASFLAALDAWLTKAQDVVTQYHKANFPNLSVPKLEVVGGQKYIKIASIDGSSRGAYAFVEVATGDVLKAASWKAPAKGKRGNIYTAELGVGPYGAHPLR